jgi:hypothetical protein
MEKIKSREGAKSAKEDAKKTNHRGGMHSFGHSSLGFDSACDELSRVGIRVWEFWFLPGLPSRLSSRF